MLSKIILCSALLITIASSAQSDKEGKSLKNKVFGINGGINRQLLTSVRSFNANNNIGFFFGAYYAPVTSSRFGARSEVLFSHQGYDYATSQQTGTVKLDYLMLPQLFTVNFSRFIQLQAGPQLGILLRGKVDSSANPSSVPDPSKPREIFNRFNFGYAAGFESNPVGGLTIGARYNLFLSLLNDQSRQSTPLPYIPDYRGKLKHGTLQFYAGYKF